MTGLVGGAGRHVPGGGQNRGAHRPRVGLSGGDRCGGHNPPPITADLPMRTRGAQEEKT